MSVRLFSKIGFLGMSGSLALISTIPNAKIETLNKFKTTKIEIPKNINSPEDIDLFEKKYGCKYLYISDSGNKEKYDWKNLIKRKRQIYPRNSEDYWRTAVMWGAKEQMTRCKKGELVILKEIYHGNFKIVP